jgi:hypothetical protein
MEKIIMTRDEVRLELLKLTYTHGREAADAVVRAKVLEAYVVETAEAPKGKKQKKDIDNPDPLS